MSWSLGSVGLLLSLHPLVPLPIFTMVALNQEATLTNSTGEGGKEVWVFLLRCGAPGLTMALHASASPSTSSGTSNIASSAQGELACLWGPLSLNSVSLTTFFII